MPEDSAVRDDVNLELACRQLLKQVATDRGWAIAVLSGPARGAHAGGDVARSVTGSEQWRLPRADRPLPAEALEGVGSEELGEWGEAEGTWGGWRTAGGPGEYGMAEEEGADGREDDLPTTRPGEGSDTSDLECEARRLKQGTGLDLGDVVLDGPIVACEMRVGPGSQVFAEEGGRPSFRG